MKGIDVFVLAGIILALSSCAPIAPQTTALPESVPARSKEPGELVKGLSQRVHQFRSLRALATVYYWGTEGRGGFQEAILVHRPDRLRLETLSPVGAVLIVTADADEVVGFDTKEKLFYRGRSSKENLSRFTQIPLDLGELTSLLMGLPPFEAQSRWQEEGNSIHRDLGGGRREVITFHHSQGIPTKWEQADPYGRIELSALFSDFSSTPAGLFPLKISLEDNVQQRRLEIRYQEPELNVALPANLFVQQRPANVKEIPIESVGG